MVTSRLTGRQKESIYPETIDGAPDAVKVACPVRSGGKSGDHIKRLPITIRKNSRDQQSCDAFVNLQL